MTEEMHHILGSIEADKIGKLQVRDYKNNVVQDFAATTSMDTIIDATCRMKGPGEYTIVAMDTRGKQLGGSRRMTVDENETPLDDDNLEVGNDGTGLASRTIAAANRRTRDLEERVERERQQLEAAREKFEREKNTTFADLMAQHRASMEALEERTERRQATMNEEHHFRREQIAAEDVARRQEHVTRMKLLESKERELERKHELAMAEMRKREIELMEREHEIESEAAENRVQIQIDKMAMEAEIRMAEFERRVQNSQTISKTILNKYYEKVLDQQFPEPSALEEMLKPVMPLLQMFQGAMPGFGQPPQPSTTVSQIGEPPKVPLPPDLPRIEDLGPAPPLPASARPRGMAPEAHGNIPLPETARQREVSGSDSFEI